MRIGLLTFHWADNYGALLQAHALRSVLEGLGHEVRVLPYAPLKLRGRDMFPSLIFKEWKGTLLPDPLMMAICSRYVLSCFGAFLKRRRQMGRFRRERLCSGRHIRKASSLDLSGLDGIVIGSDQVWNPCITMDMDAAYWAHGLNLPVSCRLVSYAASMSVYPPEGLNKERMADCLRRFDHVSVREESAKLGLQKDLGLECSVCLDPVFLLSRTDWEKLARPFDCQGP